MKSSISLSTVSDPMTERACKLPVHKEADIGQIKSHIQ